jgi:hypothetical protein
MKDAKGHGSNSRGAPHSCLIDGIECHLGTIKQQIEWGKKSEFKWLPLVGGKVRDIGGSVAGRFGF